MKKNSRLIRICLHILSLVIILFSGYQMIKIISDYRKSDLLYENAHSTFVKVIDENDTNDTSEDSSKLQSTDSEVAVGEEKTQESNGDIVVEEEKLQESNCDITIDRETQKRNCDIAVDFEQLQKINEEVVGWIYFENEDISYPILYSGDDRKYLSTAYTGEQMKAGSIFVCGANNPDFSDRHTIIYGHNMKNSSMFGKLKYYRQKENYYEDHRYFQIITPDHSYRYQIFSYREVSADSDVYQVHFADSDEFMIFVNSVLTSDSSIRSEVELTDESKIITLSTCSEKGTRFIVSAVCVEQYN